MSHSRTSSNASNSANPSAHAHTPAQPSQLRQSHAPSDRSSSPEESFRRQPREHDESQPSSSGINVSADGIQPSSRENVGSSSAIAEVDFEPTARIRAATHQEWDSASGYGEGPVSHIHIASRPDGARNYGSFAGSVYSEQSFSSGFPGIQETADGQIPDETHALLGESSSSNGIGKMKGSTGWLGGHGIRPKRIMYLQYYIPIINWTQQYQWRYFKGDLIAAITMASFYIPMALSYASNLAHVPPVHGLYSFAFNPLIYAILGTCPQMVVGPEAPGSLLVGEIVRENIKKGTTGDEDGRRNAEIAGIVTCMAGAFILIGGIFRLGFLDNVLSRPFLRGFISAIGFVIFVDQSIPEMGLAQSCCRPGIPRQLSRQDHLYFHEHPACSWAHLCHVVYSIWHHHVL